jgi:hypothetical protein
MTLLTPDPDINADFDFFMGAWRVRHRRLRSRLTGDDVWDEFDGVCETRKVLGGLGNMDDNWLDLPSGACRAVTLRMWAPSRRQWSIWWLDSRTPDIGAPVRGCFEDGVGTFIGDDEVRGKPVLNRLRWYDIGPDRASWSQAMSPDGGATWEDNWFMQFTRTG